ncbi:DUF3263 domain-containing protein [Nocardia inohanensis]|uniref:DUF3263 domain-containing protein n=1 Tax=Nocardia inohanensis TaxID=209246 RepID=UPI000A04D704|nr:DUF3263 domain-containing protein [Nocardia inohanensis]
MGPHEITMLEFAAEWAPFGGNDEEAFLRFGLTPEAFHRRLAQLLVSPAARALDNMTIARLRKQCAERARSAQKKPSFLGE